MSRRKRLASARSSEYRNSRSAEPSPHSVTDVAPLSFAAWKRWIAALQRTEFHRLERKAEMEDLSNLITSPTDRAKAKDETQQVFMRTSGP